jgi:hypothetical protein
VYEYKIISKWSGWWGGFGSENDIAAMINAEAAEGWRLVRSETSRFLWFYMPWFPRPRLLLIFERPATAQTSSARPQAPGIEPAVAQQPVTTKQEGEGPFVRR